MREDDGPRRGNIRAGLPNAAAAEAFETIAAFPARPAGRVRIERIVSDGQASPPGFWYDQGWDEWVLLLRGGAEVVFADPPAAERLGPGDWLHIPAGRRHRVGMTETDTLWLAVHGGGE